MSSFPSFDCASRLWIASRWRWISVRLASEFDGADVPAEAVEAGAVPVVPVGCGVADPEVPAAPGVPAGEVAADAGALAEAALLGFAAVAGFAGFDVLPVLTAGFMAEEALAAGEEADAGCVDELDEVEPPAACSNSFRCDRNSTSFARIAGSSCPLSDAADDC